MQKEQHTKATVCRLLLVFASFQARFPWYEPPVAIGLGKYFLGVAYLYRSLFGIHLTYLQQSLNDDQDL